MTEHQTQRTLSMTRANVALVAVTVLCAAAIGAPLGCSANSETNNFTGGGSPTGSGQGGGGSSSTGIFEDGGPNQNNVYITPTDPTLKLELPLSGQTIPFQCVDAGNDLPIPDATWSLSSLELGDISQTGVFTPNGERTGVITVGCQKGLSSAQTSLKVIIHAIDNNGVQPNMIDLLRGPPGAPDASWKFLYPYDKTVFPRGILAPEIHLTQGGLPGTAFYVHIVAPEYEYEGFFNTSAFNTQLQISQGAWTALTNTAAGNNVEVHISKVSNGQKVGPIHRTWVLAPGTLHGTIYYNTYDSPLAGQDGAMMRIKGNSPIPEVLVGNCTVCHSISADGSTAAAANHAGPGGTFDLSSGQVNPPLVWQTAELAAFAALFPKQGSVVVVNGAPGASWPPNTPGSNGPWSSELRTKNGTIIPNSGIEGFYAQSPVFSHDGTMLAFTDRDPTPPYTSVLALTNYDEVTQKFSNYQVLATPSPGRHFSWPAFTPDGKYVIYQDGLGDDLATWSGNTGRIFAVDVQTKEVIFLANLNGDGYMPAGARDENKNYEPTIAPVASGGYFWLMFTSRRTYGNKLTGSEYETKRLWVSAVSINAAPGVDPTHPAFYVSGQELTSGNSRGFWALDPCKPDGEACVTGDECCNGNCNPTGSPPQFLCAPPDGTCADEFETCTSSADCCPNKNLECINNKCVFVPPT